MLDDIGTKKADAPDWFFEYVSECYGVFKAQNGTSLNQAYDLYRKYANGRRAMIPLYKFREELRNYFETFSDRSVVDGVSVRSYYSGFLTKMFSN